MTSEVQSGYKNPVVVMDREPGAAPKMSPHQQKNPVKGKEKMLSPRGSETIKYPENLKAENCADLPFILHQRRQSFDVHVAHQKNSGNCPKQQASIAAMKSEELVKYMSNLPGYLQNMGKGENVEGRVLSFGVLEWTRLEKWKPVQKAGDCGGARVCSSSTGSEVPLNFGDGSASWSSIQRESPFHNSETQVSLGSHLPSSEKGDLNRFPSPAPKKKGTVTLSKHTLKGNENVSRTLKFPSQDDAGVINEKRRKKALGKKLGPHSGNGRSKSSKYNSSLSSGENACSFESKASKKILEIRYSDIIQINDRERGITSKVGASPTSELRKSEVPKSSINNHMNTKLEKTPRLDINLTRKLPSGQPNNIVLLLPRKVAKSSLQSHKVHTTTISTDKLEDTHQSSFSCSFTSGELRPGVLQSDIPHSCPLSSQIETYKDIIHQDVEMPSDTISSCSQKLGEASSEGKCSVMHRSKHESSSSNLEQNLKVLDEEFSEVEEKKGIEPQVNRRFSFSLGQMRSFSFKERTSLPQLSSTYVSARSGPVGTEDSCYLGIPGQEKLKVPTKGRSSPLRRLLDPLLKSRSTNSRRSAVDVQQLNSLSLSFKSVDCNETPLAERCEHSTVHALLQHTTKDGVPFFKFVVDKSNNLLVATKKIVASSRKDDPCSSFVFYSVDESKKKSGSWISYGNKVKGGAFTYSVVGQMKEIHPRSSDMTRKTLQEQVIVGEYVLTSFEAKQADGEAPDPVRNRELAAIVFEESRDSTWHIGEQASYDSDSAAGSLRMVPPDNNCRSELIYSVPSNITVILPGGVHGLPSEGQPSPLIDRWKSNGSCDCGGWDIGCRLHVLCNQSHCHKLMKTSSSLCNRLDLFVKGEAPHKEPIFSLAPFREGIHSVDFSSSISLLQAFAVSVAIVSSKKLDNAESYCLSEVKAFQEPHFNTNGAMKASRKLRVEGPAKFAPYPPLSPVGRV